MIFTETDSEKGAVSSNVCEAVVALSWYQVIQLEVSPLRMSISHNAPLHTQWATQQLPLDWNEVV